MGDRIKGLGLNQSVQHGFSVNFMIVQVKWMLSWIVCSGDTKYSTLRMASKKPKISKSCPLNVCSYVEAPAHPLLRRLLFHLYWLKRISSKERIMGDSLKNTSHSKPLMSWIVSFSSTLPRFPPLLCNTNKWPLQSAWVEENRLNICRTQNELPGEKLLKVISEFFAHDFVHRQCLTIRQSDTCDVIDQRVLRSYPPRTQFCGHIRCLRLTFYLI